MSALLPPLSVSEVLMFAANSLNCILSINACPVELVAFGLNELRLDDTVVHRRVLNHALNHAFHNLKGWCVSYYTFLTKGIIKAWKSHIPTILCRDCSRQINLLIIHRGLQYLQFRFVCMYVAFLHCSLGAQFSSMATMYCDMIIWTSLKAVCKNLFLIVSSVTKSLYDETNWSRKVDM